MAKNKTASVKLTAEEQARRANLAAKAKAQWADPNSKLRANGTKVHKQKDPPKNAANLIREAIAEYGANVTAILEELGCSRTLFYAWLKRFPELKEAFDEGRAIMEEKLVSTLFQQAMKGVYPAAMFLLKTKCGYRDSGPIVNSDETAEDKAEKIRRLLQEMDAADRDPNAPLPSAKEPVQ